MKFFYENLKYELVKLGKFSHKKICMQDNLTLFLGEFC
jgi:hypothetical protein